MTPRPLTLVWRRGVLDGVLESSFMRGVAFADLRRPLRWLAVEDGDALPVIDDALICSFGDPGDYLRGLRAQGGRNIGVFHLGDERGDDDCGFYELADYVLRHYYRPSHAAVCLANGWANGVGPCDPAHHLSFAERRHGLFFAGYADSAVAARGEMLDALKTNRIPAAVMLTPGFGQGLGAAAYAGHMGDARFALCPAGKAPETVRLFDALEQGAIPIVVGGDWLGAADGLGGLGPPPLVVLENWRDLAAFMAPHLEGLDEPALEEWENRRGAAVDWWRRMKRLTSRRVAEVIEQSFAQ